MASYSATQAKHITLVASTVDDIRIDGEFNLLNIVNRDSTSPVYVRWGRGTTAAAVTDPTVAGDNTIVIPGSGSIAVDWPFEPVIGATTPVYIKVIGAGTGGVSVQGI